MGFNTLAFIGRFQPFHNGHKAVVDKALELADKVAIVIGSHDIPRNSRNPFTTAERIKMITVVYPAEVAAGRIFFVPQEDHAYNLDRWIAGVTTGVNAVAMRGGWTDKPPSVGLIGHAKDSSSFYLKAFPHWGSVEVANVDGIDATKIREMFFVDEDAPTIPGMDRMMPVRIVDWMLNWGLLSEAFDQIEAEMAFVATYKKQFDVLPYPPTFNTTDAIVVQSGHILLVKRGAQPGKGLWALPGGFLEQNETQIDGVLRELREETKIGVPTPVIRGSLVAQKTFDDPHRSLRGRTITQAFYFRLADRETLPKIKGSDDAEKARWVPLAELKRSMMYEDHYDMVQSMVGI